MTSFIVMLSDTQEAAMNRGIFQYYNVIFIVLSRTMDWTVVYFVISDISDCGIQEATIDSYLCRLYK